MQTKGNTKKVDDSFLSFEQSTTVVESNEEEYMEDRIINKKELEDLGVLSFTFCVICQNVSTPSRVPVVCNGCDSAIFC